MENKKISKPYEEFVTHGMVDTCPCSLRIAMKSEMSPSPCLVAFVNGSKE